MTHCQCFVLFLIFAVTTASAVNNEGMSEETPEIFLELRPIRNSNDPRSTFIYYKANDMSSVRPWVKIINDSLVQYRKRDSNGGVAKNRVVCTSTSHYLKDNQVCDVEIDEFHPCTSANLYNYHSAGPCVFFNLNKIFNWTPILYNSKNDLPAHMPEDLKQHIKMVSGKPEANTVWVSCEGENPADVEIMGPIQYIPRRGFPAHYYPFTNQEGYLSPLVAVLFENPRMGVLINIECKAWAKNIFHDRYERRGSFHLELMVDRS